MFLRSCDIFRWAFSGLEAVVGVPLLDLGADLMVGANYEYTF